VPDAQQIHIGLRHLTAGPKPRGARAQTGQLPGNLLGSDSGLVVGPNRRAQPVPMRITR
jgi:hypothetical protein